MILPWGSFGRDPHPTVPRWDKITLNIQNPITILLMYFERSSVSPAHTHLPPPRAVVAAARLLPLRADAESCLVAAGGLRDEQGFLGSTLWAANYFVVSGPTLLEQQSSGL